MHIIGDILNLGRVRFESGSIVKRFSIPDASWRLAPIGCDWPTLFFALRRGFHQFGGSKRVLLVTWIMTAEVFTEASEAKTSSDQGLAGNIVDQCAAKLRNRGGTDHCS